MAMQGYFDVFPEKRTTELRTAIFADGNADDPLPDGTFLFTEYFCTDPRCNCQRVLVKVFHAARRTLRRMKSPRSAIAGTRAPMKHGTV